MSNLLTGNFPTKTYRNISLLNTGVVIKAAKGQIFSAYLFNSSNAIRYVKLYDKSTTPTASDTPTATLPLAAGTGVSISCGTAGEEYLLGISARATTGVADNDNGAPSANDVIVNISYL